DLYGDRDVVGEQIRVRGIPFVVIGLLAERGTGLDAFDEDEVVFVPLKTARRRLFQVDYVQRLFIRADASANVGVVGATVAALLRGTHPTTATDAPDFRVQDQRRLVSLRETTIARLGAFQWIVASVLLTAGAAGVFALQFLSVRERQSEVGTRRAVGATRAMIFAQFVAEATVITVGGGVLGVIIGMFGVGVAGVRVSVPVAIAAFSASCIAGIAAAFEPARRAAYLPPAVAFRGQ
ncbi:MAG: ABC transporter permease, partial [Gemmatimonadaceae bacterium]